MYIRQKKKKNAKYFQAWSSNAGQDRFVQHLGTVEIIVLNTQIINELKQIHPEVYKQLRDIVGHFRTPAKEVGQ